MSFFDEISSRLAKVELTKIVGPSQKIEAGLVLGTLNEKSQKMYAVWQSFVEDHLATMRGEKEGSCDELHQLIDISEMLFWSEVHEEFEKMDGYIFALFEGFQVAAIKIGTPSNPFEGNNIIIAFGADPNLFFFN